MMEPKIRFKGFEGEWKTSTIGDFTTSFSGGTPTAGASEFYGGNIPFIRSGEIHESKTELFLTDAGLNNSSAKVVEKGTLLYALYGATSGEVGISKIKGAINQAILAIYPNKTVDKRFLANYLQSHKQKIVGELLQGGQGNLSGALVKSISVNYPNNREQQAISDYVDSLDSQISASTSRLASLKQMKAASLQAMFPQEGETVPKIRFKGFEGEWKKVMFSETFEFLKNNSLSRAELSNEGDIVNVHYGDVLIKYGDLLNIQNEELTFIADNKIGNTLYNSCHLQNGDIIIADAAEDNTVGKCSEIVNICNKRVVSGLHTIPCRPLNRFAQGYLGHYINSESYHNQLLPLIQGSKISSISKKTLSQTIVLVPSIEEQKCIGNYFTSLDRQISLQSQRLKKLKQIKSACLDKMFV